jgi:hypothetical protein
VARGLDPSTHSFFVGDSSAVEVDRLAEGVCNGCVETCELRVYRRAVLGRDLALQLFEQGAKPPHDLDRR